MAVSATHLESLHARFDAGGPVAHAPASEELARLLSRARERAAGSDAAAVGRVTPQEAWWLVQNDHAVLVDVRTAEERKFVGHVPGSLHVPWALGTALQRNPRFVRELESRVARGQRIVLLCRSGARSAAAAAAAAQARFTDVFNVLEGFEGDLDDRQQRGHGTGWRFHGLPWIQD
jgi:rhodanese-related sulfurtransferase